MLDAAMRTRGTADANFAIGRADAAALMSWPVQEQHQANDGDDEQRGPADAPCAD